MLPKPDRCRGCPWFGDGRGFVPDEVPEGVPVIFIAQNPGECEEVQGRPLIGVTGQMFRNRFVRRHLTGTEVGYANIVKCRQQGAAGQRTNAMPVMNSHLWEEVVSHCRPYLQETLAKAPTAILVPLGEHAAKAITGLRAKAMLHLRGTTVEVDDL